MYKKVFEYESFDGEQVTDVLYFNLTRTEMIRFMSEYPEGLDNYIAGLNKGTFDSETFAFFEKVIGRCYGIRSEDGKKFRKSPAILEEFKESAAYDAFIYYLITEEGAMDEFMANVFPKLSESEIATAKARALEAEHANPQVAG